MAHLVSRKDVAEDLIRTMDTVRTLIRAGREATTEDAFRLQELARMWDGKPTRMDHMEKLAAVRRAKSAGNRNGVRRF